MLAWVVEHVGRAVIGWLTCRTLTFAYKENIKNLKDTNVLQENQKSSTHNLADFFLRLFCCIGADILAWLRRHRADV